MPEFNFTDDVRRVLATARVEATRLQHEYIGTEHILLGLIAELSGGAANTLRSLGADTSAIRDAVESTIKRGQILHANQQPYTSRTQRVFELSMQAARALNHDAVDTQHLLLGLAAERKGIGAQILHQFGITEDKIREHLEH
jgi:ATP-dependent Clp protease ATP-binding subunit ClpC